MSVQRESRRESYDAVVVGSGMGGLAAAAFLARAGKSVLVVERHDRPGGYAHSFLRKKYKFDSGVHVISGCEPLGAGWGALLHDILTFLGTRETVEFAKVDPLFGAFYPGRHFAPPTGVMEFLDAHAQLFPAEARGLKAFLRLMAKINQETYNFPPEASSYDTLRDPSRFPVHARLRGATLRDVLDEHLSSPELKAMLGTQWLYLGLPPSRVSILKYSSMLMSFLSTGTYFPKGGMQMMVNAIVAGIQAQGGEVMTSATVRRVLVENGRATGVALENGQKIRAPLVVSNVDARQTFEDLVGVEHLPGAFVTALRAMRPSLSAVVVYLATDLDLRSLPGLEHETFLYDSWDHDQTYAEILAGRPGGILLSMPSLTDPSLAPDGEYLVNVMTLMPFDHASSWRESKARYMDLLLTRAEAALPGLRGRLTLVEGGSPRTMERYTLNYMGAIYGWEQSPQQGGANRLSRVTPVEGLYLAGHWTQPGGGAMSAAASGAQTAQLILGYPTVARMLDSLGGPPATHPAPAGI